MTPENEQALSEIIKSATGPLRITGGGTRPIGDAFDGTPLNTGALNGVTLYEPGALTLVVKSGTPLQEVETLLAGEGQRLAFEPMDHRHLLATTGEPTIGGMVAANISGPRRVQTGACRDFLLGVRFVDGVGNIVKNGGRVMKNVTGYDLVKLMAGSFGSLGVLSEVSLKVLPTSEVQASLLIDGLDDTRAIKALSVALGSPYEISGAAHISAPQATTVMRLEGFAASVAYRTGQLQTLLREFGDIQIESDVDRSRIIWRELRDVSSFCQATGDVWRCSVKPSDAPNIGARLHAACDARLIYDWGGGLVWALVPEGFDLRAQLKGIPGHARIERAHAEIRRKFTTFPPELPVLRDLSKGIRARFDPRGILNSGLMGQ